VERSAGIGVKGYIIKPQAIAKPLALGGLRGQLS
jgi:hypothetical protein